jgi:hypothetical protein
MPQAGMTCLHIAADKEDMKMVEFICELNIDPEMLMATHDEVSSNSGLMLSLIFSHHLYE